MLYAKPICINLCFMLCSLRPMYNLFLVQKACLEMHCDLEMRMLVKLLRNIRHIDHRLIQMLFEWSWLYATS